MRKITACILILISILPAYNLKISYDPQDIYLSLKKLNVLGSALYIAAHPDDENQAILSYLSKGRLLRTAYLSLTRGDGGQNLLGSEKGALLGVLRTQELLAARSIDGAEQFFSRAVDFGYSKTAQETLQKWNRDSILSDVVKVIRYFKPDIIITRFSEENGGHGHHLSSAILAKEALKDAADPFSFTEQLTDLKPWRTTRLMWNTWMPDRERPADSPAIIKINLGEYNPLLGKSYQEIASLSRTMHKSQGFGSTANRGQGFNYFEHTSGKSAQKDLLEDIYLSWDKVPGSSQVQQLINKAISEFDFKNPSQVLPVLLDLNQEMKALPQSHWTKIKRNELKQIILACSGLWLEAISADSYTHPGEQIKLKIRAINRSSFPLTMKEISIPLIATSQKIDSLLKFNIPLDKQINLKIPENMEYSQKYWLKKQNSEYRFSYPDSFFKFPDNPPFITARLKIQFSNTIPMVFDVPVNYRFNDAIDGETYQPFLNLPKASVSLDKSVYIFNNKEAQRVTVNVNCLSDSLYGLLKLNLPSGWKSEPQKINFESSGKSQQKFDFIVIPDGVAEGKITANLIVDNNNYNQEIITIDYKHIPKQTVLQPAQSKALVLDLKAPPKKIGYIMGSGDDIPLALKEIGMDVTLLSDEEIANSNLDLYDVIICGVRAFNTRSQLELSQDRLLNYVKNGGTWIVQHNTRFGQQVKQIGPYPFTARGRDRVSEEDAPVEILEPNHPLLNYPNKITQADFRGWVQERATYMAESWEGPYTPLFASNDQDEEAKAGGLLYSEYGEGVFIFTAFSWFRQLPAGVPGAYKIFVNMICAGDEI